MDGNPLTIEREVTRWTGVTSEPGRFGATVFRYGKREIGHVHRDGIADLPVTRRMRETLLGSGRARPHRAGSNGYVSYPVEDQQGVSVVLEVLGSNYDRAKAAAEKKRNQQESRQAETPTSFPTEGRNGDERVYRR